MILFRGLWACFVLFGVLSVFLLPPFQVPDETTHWTTHILRIHRLIGRESPRCSTALGLPGYFEFDRIAFHGEQKVRSGSFDGLKNLSITCLPDSHFEAPYGFVFTYPGVLLAHFLTGPWMDMGKISLLAFYLSRLFQGILMAWVLFQFYRVIERGQSSSIQRLGILLIFLLCLTPLYVQQSFAVSADGVTNAFTLYLALWLISMPALNPRDVVEFSLLGFMAIYSKPTLLPLFVPVVLFLYLKSLPAFCAGIQKRKTFSKNMKLLLGVSLLLCLVGVFSVFNAPAFQTTHGDVNPALQVRNVIAHPWNSFLILTRSWANYFKSFGWLFSELGNFDLRMNKGTQTTYIIGALLSFLAFFSHSTNREMGLRNIRRNLTSSKRVGSILLPYGVVILGTLASMYLVCSYLYLTWTSVGTPIVEGNQGRYFFSPIVLLIGLVTAFFQEFRLPSSSENETIAERAKVSKVTKGLLGLLLVILCFHLTSRSLDFLIRYW